MVPLVTDRLRIRQFTAADGEALLEMIVQYQASEYAAYDHPWPTAPEEIRKVAEWFAAGDQYLAVCLRETGRFIGFVCLNPRQTARVYNLGYIFNFDHHGRGYATEACRAMLGRAFAELQAERIVTGTAAANVPSVHLLGRLGFTGIGNGEYALSREEWERGTAGDPAGA
ncbi:MAG: GNAT family N-acetyltransferase [Candidatus Latescibacterota bacterium]